MLMIFSGSMNRIIQKNCNFKLGPDVKYAVFGHSHPECALDDSIVKKLKNLSQSADPYFYIYYKIKKIAEQNPQVKTYFIEFSNNFLDSRVDTWIWQKEFLCKSYPNLSPFIDFDDIFFILKKSPINFLRAFSISLRNNFEKIVNNDYSYINEIGKYNYLKRDKTKEILKSIKNNTFPKINYEKKNYYSIHYLKKIILFLKQNSKNVYLIRCPQHKMNPETANEKDFLEILNIEFNNIDFLDFNNFPLTDEEYGDLGHLNYRGAAKFSKWFNILINDKIILSQSNKQKIINSTMDEFKKNQIN